MHYVRLHGSPAPTSPHAPEFFVCISARLVEGVGDAYCILDNTGAGAAPLDALTLRSYLSMNG